MVRCLILEILSAIKQKHKNFALDHLFDILNFEKYLCLHTYILSVPNPNFTIICKIQEFQLFFLKRIETCSQRLYRLIGYADSEYDIVNNMWNIFVVVVYNYKVDNFRIIPKT